MIPNLNAYYTSSIKHLASGKSSMLEDLDLLFRKDLIKGSDEQSSLIIKSSFVFFLDDFLVNDFL